MPELAPGLAPVGAPGSEAALRRRSPFHGLQLPQQSGLVTVADAGPVARFVYRGKADRIAAAFGVRPSAAPMHAATGSGRAALWLGPDEWLLLAPDAEAQGLAQSLAAALGQSLPGEAAALVDVGHRQGGLAAVGPWAPRLLSAGCPLDLDPEAFPVGMCTRTLLGKAGIVLWRREQDAFHIEVERSYARYVAGLLNEAARVLA